jgi:hypothetical protein
MKAIVRRVGRLEERLTPKGNAALQRAADLLWERRQRRLKEAGLPFETVKPQYSPGPYMSFAETLRSCRQERLARQRGERETAGNSA